MSAMTTPAPSGQSGYQTTTYAYDPAGNLTKTTAPPTSDAQGAPDQVTYDSYNAAEQLATQTTAYGTSTASTTSYCYDPNSNTTAVVAPDGNTSGSAACENSSPWAVSSSGYPAQAAYQTTYSYDSAGEIVSATRPATAAGPVAPRPALPIMPTAISTPPPTRTTSRPATPTPRRAARRA